MKEETKNILLQAYEEVAEDPKLIWLTTITTFVHSLIITGYIIWQIYIFLNGADATYSFQFAQVFVSYIKQLTQSPSRIVFLITLFVIVAFAYLLLPPVGYSAIIYRISGKAT